jgi:hypothetical protein
VREIRVHKPGKSEKLAENAVRKLQFTEDAAHLLAWVGWEWRADTIRHWNTSNVYTHNLGTGDTQVVGEEWAIQYQYAGTQGEPAVSPDARFFVFEYEDVVLEAGGVAELVDQSKPDEPGASLTMGNAMTGGFAFTADSLFAARNTRNRNDHTAEVVRLPLDSYNRPTRFREGTNPFTGQPMPVPVHDVRWRPVATLPRGEAAKALAISRDGRLAAVGMHRGALHVVDIKKKRVVFSQQWLGRHVRDRVATRVGFHPGGVRVAMIANGRLFAHPLKPDAGQAWQTKPALGYLHDFAYHPAGRVMAVVDSESRARYLDPLTGVVRNEFRWKRGPLYSVAFSPDGLLCAAGAGGGRVVLWDVDE